MRPAGASSSNRPLSAIADDDDLVVLLAEQSQALVEAKTAYSDLDFAYQLQMQEAVEASLLNSPTADVAATSVASPIASPRNVDDVAAVAFYNEEIERLRREQADLQYGKAEVRKMVEYHDLLLHDHKVASEIMKIPDEEWQETGDEYQRPYTKGFDSTLSSSYAIEGRYSTPSEVFCLYCKGMVVEDENKVKLAAIGLAICDSKSDVLIEVSKPLVVMADAEMSGEIAELEALIEGLELAHSLELGRITCYCHDSSIKQYLDGIVVPLETKVAGLVEQAALLMKGFSHCRSVLASKNDIQFASELARSSIAKRCGKPVKQSILFMENCPICLEDVDSAKMSTVDRCQHRYCFSCIKKHVELKVIDRKLPKCPHPNCGSELNVTDCRKYIPPRLYDAMDQLLKESSIPVADKVYCPNPRCSKLMSRNEALKNRQGVAGSSSTMESSACRCVKCHMLFCINCKVQWHTHMSCNTYNHKRRRLDPNSADVKMERLARNKKWRQCPKCSHMVDLAAGCHHISCRCGHEFCYLCGNEWKNKKATCACPLWSEDKIIRGHNPGMP